MAAEEHKTDVCVVGAGPVGVYLSLRLAAAGFDVTILEASTEISDAPRAVSHMPTLFAEYKKVGIWDYLTEVSQTHSGGVSYRRTSDQELIDRIPPIPNRPGPMAVPQKEFTTILIRKLEDHPNARLLLGHKVVSVEDSPDDITTTAKDATGTTKVFKSAFVVGADGGKSFVRGVMGQSYEGESLPYKLIAADVFFPFEKYGYDGANFMLDPENYGNIAEVNEIEGKRSWRVGVGFPSTMSDKEVMDALPAKFDAMFPGPKPSQYELIRAQPYQANQLCVSSFRKGRMMLVGDAAHLVNPYSGQLLASGIFDASSLASVLVAIGQRNAPADELLDAWAADRLSKFHKILDPLSRKCLAAVQDPDAATIADRHPFLKAFKTKAGPPPTLETNLDSLNGWVPSADATAELGTNKPGIQLIWSKA